MTMTDVVLAFLVLLFIMFIRSLHHRIDSIDRRLTVVEVRDGTWGEEAKNMVTETDEKSS